MKKYVENISDVLKFKIKQFIEENNETIVDYQIWRKALNLYIIACDEIRKSVEGFGEEFDEIIKNYKSKHIDNEFSNRELELINEVNTNLSLLYERYIVNLEVRTMLNQLIAKKYQ